MKIIGSCLIGILFACLFQGGQAHFECHTEEPDEDTASFFQTLFRRYESSASRRRLAGGTDYVVPTYYHLIEEVGLPTTSDETVLEQHSVLNDAFFGTGFSFEFKGITRTEVPASADPLFPGDAWFEDEESLRASLHVGDFDTLNIFVPQLPFFFGGYASLPTVLLLDSPEQDGVVINADYLPGGASLTNNLGKVLAHEASSTQRSTLQCRSTC